MFVHLTPRPCAEFGTWYKMENVGLEPMVYMIVAKERMIGGVKIDPAPNSAQGRAPDTRDMVAKERMLAGVEIEDSDPNPNWGEGNQ